MHNCNTSNCNTSNCSYNNTLNAPQIQSKSLNDKTHLIYPHPRLLFVFFLAAASLTSFYQNTHCPSFAQVQTFSVWPL